MNYIDAFIAVADDSPTAQSLVPQEKGGKKTVAVIQYEMLVDHPYELTQEDVLFETHARHKEISAAELKKNGKKLRDEFFAKDQPCLRTSPLARKYGWGFHFDPKGKVALYAIESKEYKQMAKKASKVLKALRSSRA
ncbi:MAG TPA: DUF6157 family protein [Kofleriaceae bacterium]